MKRIAFLEHVSHLYKRRYQRLALILTCLFLLFSQAGCFREVTKSVEDVIYEVEKTRETIDIQSDAWRAELSKLQDTLKSLESQVNADTRGILADTAIQVQDLTESAIQLTDAKAQNLIAQAGTEFRCNTGFVKRGVLDQLQSIVDNLRFWQDNKRHRDRKPDHAVCWINPSVLSLYPSGNNWLIDTRNMSEPGIVYVFGYNLRPDALPTLELQDSEGKTLRDINVRAAYVTNYQVNLDFANETFPDVHSGARVVFRWPDFDDPNTVNLSLHAPGTLQISNPVFSPASPTAQEESVILKVTISNTGGSPVQAFTIEWRPDPNGERVFTVSAPSPLQPGESRDFSLGSYKYQRSGTIEGIVSLSTGDDPLRPSVLVLAPAISPILPAEYWTESFSEEGAGVRTCKSGFAVAGISCRGDYCDNKLLLCRPYLPQEDDARGSYWHPQVISEEQPNASFRTDILPEPGFVGGLGCSGKYCDNISFFVITTPHILHTGAWEWKPFVSEEGPGRSICAQNQFVTGVGCKGEYCDKISLHCSTVRFKGQ